MPGRIPQARTLSQQWRNKARRAPGLGRRWAALSRAFLREHPFCVECGKMAEVTDHIKPRAEGGGHERENLQPLCWSCHSKKTRKEMMDREG